MQFTFSFIIPVYNRPQEIRELLDSFIKVKGNEVFEIVIVEDGSSLSSKDIIINYTNQLNLTYLEKQNSGPGDSRNFGMKHAKGDYFIILDSDCLVPPTYFENVVQFLKEHPVDCFGGADTAAASFTALQKAINYVMTSFITTGGLRGHIKAIQKFEPRSFNMGISKKAFLATGGFSKIHPGEDPDLSQRILKKGFKTAFIPNAAVFHKRRISWKKFYTQVQKFGMVRPILNKWHPEAAKITFWFPTFFVFFTVCSILLGLLVSLFFILPLSVYICLVLIGSAWQNKNIWVGVLSVVAMFIQFFGYGIAFMQATFYIQLLKKDPEKQFPKLFFK